MNDALLSTHNLSIGYHGKALLDGLNLSLRPGKLVCFMGPNGIGKSTLIRTLAGLQKPIAGAVSINKQSEFPAVSVVLTEKISLLYMTVIELVTLGRYPYLNWNVKLSAQDQHIVSRSLEQVKITSLSDKRLHELSDGQLQLVMVARALAQDTEIILLDEPTAHLDLNNRLEIMNLLRELAHSTQKSILIATHELDLALQTADEIWLASRDHQILQGIPEDLILNGAFDYIFQLKGFDLKTGKVMHHAHRHQTIRLSGEGYELRWTRNALERAGYAVSTDHGLIAVDVAKLTDVTFEWTIDKSTNVASLEALLQVLTSKIEVLTSKSEGTL